LVLPHARKHSYYDHDQMTAHPMHLHGHSFQVIAIDGRAIQGVVRDTVLARPMGGRVRIAFDADNPGRRAFHCTISTRADDDGAQV
jgi:FtsP/CotA-like multicopper oxidase with cupredoxin domain